jgi:hypothetical protein
MHKTPLSCFVPLNDTKKETLPQYKHAAPRSTVFTGKGFSISPPNRNAYDRSTFTKVYPIISITVNATILKIWIDGKISFFRHLTPPNTNGTWALFIFGKNTSLIIYFFLLCKLQMLLCQMFSWRIQLFSSKKHITMQVIHQ